MRQHAIGAGARDQIGHQLGGNRHPAFVLAILPGIAVVGNDGGDSLGAGPFETVDDHQQFHQTVVDRRTGGLHQKDVAAADILFDLAVDFAIGKVADRDRSDGQAQIAADLSRQIGIRATAENFEIVHVLIVPGKPARRAESSCAVVWKPRSIRYAKGRSDQESRKNTAVEETTPCGLLLITSATAWPIRPLADLRSC